MAFRQCRLQCHIGRMFINVLSHIIPEQQCPLFVPTPGSSYMNMRTFFVGEFSEVSLCKFRVRRTPCVPTSLQSRGERIHRVESLNGYLNVYYRLSGKAMNCGRTYVINSHRQRPKLASEKLGFAAKFQGPTTGPSTYDDWLTHSRLKLRLTVVF